MKRIPVTLSVAALFAGTIMAYGAPAASAQAAKRKPGPAKPAAAKPAPPRTSLKPYVQSIPGAAARIEMVGVPGGTLTIASPDGKGPGRKATVKDFYIARTETTWEMFDAYTASGPASNSYDRAPADPDAISRPSRSYIPPDLGWGHAGYPVINITSHAAEMFCRWLSSVTGKKYRLATEAEWEQACRSGLPRALRPLGKDLGLQAWYEANSGGQTHPVRKKQPNALGLYDMLGNVAEWAVDLDGKPVVCGGSFADKPARVHSGARARQTAEWTATDPQFPKSKWWLADAPFVGFRIVCEP